MRLEKDIDQDIERCQGQIAATFEPDYSFGKTPETVIIIREGFQRQLKFLFNEKSTFNIEVYNPRVVLQNRPTAIATKHGSSFHQRALETCNHTIQQLNTSAS